MNTMADNVVLQTDIKEFPLTWRGKVRDIYDLGENLLFVASDRISAFDVVMPNGIPGKGKVLTAMSLFWFDYLKDTVDSHLVTANIDEYPEELKKYRDQLEGRSMIVCKADRVDAECIVRGYISGSMWKELKAARKNGSNVVHGFEFPADLQESQKLPETLFTPSSKNDTGHDENISYKEAAEILCGTIVCFKGKTLSAQAYSSVMELLKSMHGPSHRAVSETLGSCPLPISGPDIRF